MHTIDADYVKKAYLEHGINVRNSDVKFFLDCVKNKNQRDAEQALDDFIHADLREIEGDNAEAAWFESYR